MKSDGLLEELGVARVEQTRAEARLLNLMVDYADAAQDEAELEENVHQRGYLISVIADEIACKAGTTVHFVQHTLARARLVRANLPATWAAFTRGDITAYAVREIGRHTSQLRLAESFEKLDDRLAGYASTHTATETSTWVSRRVRTLEPQTADERERDAERDRRVSFSYDTDNGGGSLWAGLPTQKMIEIEQVLKASLKTKPEDDTRTRDQFLADEVHARLTQDADGVSLVTTDVLVTVPVTTLAGLDDAPRRDHRRTHPVARRGRA